MAKKRGRPRIVKPETAGVAVAEAAVTVYAERYAGRRWWLLGIKVDKERGQLPCHSHVCGGLNWGQGTQRQTESDGWAALDDHRSRSIRVILSWDQVNAAVTDVKAFIVRWRRHIHMTSKGAAEGYATEIISLVNRYKVRDEQTKTFRPSGYRYQPLPADEPLSKYLVLVPKQFIAKQRGFLPQIADLPTMLELDPTLVSDRLLALSADEVAEDEVW